MSKEVGGMVGSRRVQGAGSATPPGGLSVTVNARGLLAHQGHRVRGMGVQRGDDRHPVRGRARVVDAAQAYQLEVRYGLDGRQGLARWAPYIGVESGGGSRRAAARHAALVGATGGGAVETASRRPVDPRQDRASPRGLGGDTRRAGRQRSSGGRAGLTWRCARA